MLNTRIRFLLTVVSSIFIGVTSAYADLPNFSAPKHSRIKILFDRSIIQPSESTSVGNLALYIELDPGWHTYWEYSGEAARPAKIEWVIPTDFSLGQPRWEAPKRYQEKGEIIVYGYDSSALIKWPLELSKLDYTGGKESESVDFRVQVSLLVCKDTCVPEQHVVDRSFIVSSEQAIGQSPDAQIFKASENSFPTPPPSPIPVVHSDRGLIFSIEKLLKQSVEPQSASAGIQLFPKPIGKIPGAIDAQLISFKTAPTSIPQLGVVLPDLLNDKSELGGVLAISGEISRTGRNQYYELPTVKSPTNSQPTKIFAAETFGPLTYLSERVGAKLPDQKLPAATEKKSFNFYILFLAFVGGLILNLMPCVLPVLSIKVFSIVNFCQNRRTLLGSAVFYALGVVASFAALAVLIAALKSAGHSVGWGFQFQSLYFLYFMVSAVFVFSLVLMSGHGISPPLANELNQQCNDAKHPLGKSFLEGILATLLSTPCSAPIVATVLAFALSSPLIYALPTFVAMGLGLAFPVLLLSFVPQLSILIPKPGAWMIRFREFLALILLGTVVWLLGVIQTISPAGILHALYLIFLLSVLCWIFELVEVRPIQRFIHHTLKLGILIIGFFGVFYFATQAVDLKEETNIKILAPSSRGIAWQVYDPGKLLEAAKENRPVFIDFSAAWCITCKFNEQFTINTTEVIKAFEESRILPLKADWTDGNEIVTKAIQSYGAEGVPLYVVLHPGKDPIILSTIPSQSAIIEALHD